MEYREKTLDCLIMGMLYENSSCSITAISERLRLPKTEIMKRIQFLSQKGYLFFSDRGFYLTRSGHDAAVIPDAVSYTVPDSGKSRTERFPWESCDYIPSPQMFKRRKSK